MSPFNVKVLTGPTAEKDLVALLNRTFPVPQGKSFFDDFPIWEEKYGATLHRLGAYLGDSTKLVSTASARLVNLKSPVPGKSGVPVALIGGVSTDEECRGHGIASTMVEQLVKWAEEKGAVFAFLWGSEHDMYRRLGFDLAGTQVRMPLAETQLPVVTGKLQIQRGWDARLLKVLQRRPYGLEITEKDSKWLAAHKNVEWYWVPSGDDVAAYAAIGRGIDLPEIIHEWGGDRKTLLELFSALFSGRPELQILGPANLIDDLGFEVLDQQLEFLGLARIFDIERLVKSYYPKILDAEMEGLKQLTGKNLIQALLGPSAPIPLKTSSTEIAMLPIPFWLWGLDGA
jgi:GNAT superfamily N-acetyltransferase